MHVFVNFRHYLWIEPKSDIVAYKALQYSQITDNIYKAFMMAWDRASLESISCVAPMPKKVVHPCPRKSWNSKVIFP